MDDYQDDGKWDDKEESGTNVHNTKNNVLPLWGNEKTMNLNTLILTNIQSSHYFKVNLYELKSYHEVIDEIYFKVSHLEPWEKGSRKTAGQTGMCGGVRGVGAGGIVSTAFCLLYKLFTLKLTRKQVIGLITHPDSPYIRVLGFMYIRYTQPPADLWDWYEPYLDDAEELDVKAGGGQIMSIGNILKNFLCKLEWFSTLFPRIPVPIQQKLERKMSERYPSSAAASASAGSGRRPGFSSRGNSHSKFSPKREVSSSRDGRDQSSYSRSREHDSVDRHRKSSDRDHYRERSPNARNGDQSSSRDEYNDRGRYKERDQRRSPERDQERSRYRNSKERDRERTKEYRYRKEYDNKRYKDEEYNRKDRKYREEYVREKSHRRSDTPDRKRSHKEDGRSHSRYSDDDYAHRKSDRRRSSEEKCKYKEETDIKRSRYYD